MAFWGVAGGLWACGPGVEVHSEKGRFDLKLALPEALTGSAPGVLGIDVAGLEVHLVQSAASDAAGQVSLHFEGALSTTSTTATGLIDAFKAGLTVRSGVESTLRIAAPEGAELTGRLQVVLPAALGIKLRSTGPGCWVQELLGTWLDAKCHGPMRIDGFHGGTLVAAVQDGNLLIDALVERPSSIQAQVAAGSIQLQLPWPVDLNLLAETQAGQIAPQSPPLPALDLAQPRRYAIGQHVGAACQVQLSTAKGDIVIRTR